jgi:5'-nucleotidase
VFVVLIHQGGRSSQIRPAGLRRSERADHRCGEAPDPAIRLVITGHSHEGYLCKVDGRAVTQADMGGHV